VLEQPNVASAPLLPLTTLTIKLEQLGSHLECALLQLFVRLCVNCLGKMHDWLEVDIGFFFGGFLILIETVRTTS
jgi:hypothetical protein